MIEDLVEKAEESEKELVAGKVKVGISLVKLAYDNAIEFKQEIDKPSGEKINFVKFKNEWCEVIEDKEYSTGGFYLFKDGKYENGKLDKYLKTVQKTSLRCYVIKVLKQNEPFSYPTSVDYFVFPGDYGKKLGLRCKSFKILLDIGKPIHKVIKAKNIKYESGKVACVGDGSSNPEKILTADKAKRWNKAIEKFMPTACICAYHRNFPKDKIINKLPFSEVQEKYLQKRGEDQFYFIQGAWRKIVKTNEQDKVYEFEEMKYSCDVNYKFSFLCPDFGSFNKFEFEGKGEIGAKRLIKQVLEMQKYLAGRIDLVPLTMNVVMEEKNTMSSGKRLYPIVYFDYPSDMADYVARNSKKALSEGAQTTTDESTGEEAEFTEYSED